MEFTLMCPKDGQVDLGLEDISAIAFRDPESVEVVFICPKCGVQMRAELRVPNMLMAALEIARLAEGGDGIVVETDSSQGEPTDLRVERERLEESYCEYFRRQLSHVECVEDLLSEIDCR
ncbi:MAG: hypothetical protein Q8S43_03295 [Actinomycetota bacterium]|nr:MAG: hypothetical protein FD171_728 [Actinomycetota bacterium]MDO8949269.1 hypothetical protein [Actinomycetota bacterium]MDP3629965.1 hypothetical protein [Actinomycetota bacterium]